MRRLIEELCERFPGRGACTDAERRAAVRLHDELRARGHEAWMETLWVRPQWAATLALHGALGVVASVLSTSAPEAALALAAVATVSAALEASGRGALLRLLFFRRATQVVLTEPPDPDAIALVITASTDAPRRGLVLRDGARRAAARARRAVGGHAPGGLAWAAIALAGVTIAAGARVGGAEGTLVGALQFVPTALLLAAMAAALDIALSDFAAGANDNASGVAVALALLDELTLQPPERLSPALLLAGAGELLPLGARVQMRRERRSAADTVVLELRTCGAGSVAWTARHPQIERACREAGGRREKLRRPAAAPPRLPSLTVRCLEGIAPREVVDDDALTGALDFCLAVIDELDALISARAPGT